MKEFIYCEGCGTLCWASSAEQVKIGVEITRRCPTCVRDLVKEAEKNVKDDTQGATRKS
jgi:hypothetical protein